LVNSGANRIISELPCIILIPSNITHHRHLRQPIIFGKNFGNLQLVLLGNRDETEKSARRKSLIISVRRFESSQAAEVP
jgi:hypothetical protein